MVTTDDFNALVAAVDDSDGGALLILADAVEDSGDEQLSLGLRMASMYKLHNYTWVRGGAGKIGTNRVRADLYRKMTCLFGVADRKVTGYLCGKHGTFRSVSVKGDTLKFSSLCDAYLAPACAFAKRVDL